LWLVDLAGCAPALIAIENTKPRLSCADDERLAGIKDAGERQQRRAAHIALRILIARLWGEVWAGSAYHIAQGGQPSLQGAPGHFSLSHTESLALIGLAEQEIGVDVERRRALRLSKERRASIERAAERLLPQRALPSDPEERILQAWVRLEALAKADGSGIGRTLTRLGAGPREPSGALSGTTNLASYRVYDLEAGPGLHAAVALRGNVPVPRLFRFPAAIEAIAALIEGANPPDAM
jgi:4'-phosphopantetheinyl transferase